MPDAPPSQDLTAPLADLRRRLVGRYGPRLEALVLFGSHARGDARPDSDVDVLAVLAGEVNAFDETERMGVDVFEVEMDHGLLLSVVPVAADDYRAGASALVRNVREEGRPA